MASSGPISVVPITCQTTAGTQVFSLGGITDTPVGAWAALPGAVDLDVLEPNLGYGYGACGSGTQMLFATGEENDASSTNNRFGHSSSNFIGLIEWTGSAFNFAQAELVSYGPGTITVNWTTPPIKAYRGLLLVAHGAGVAATGEFSNNPFGSSTPNTKTLTHPFNAIFFTGHLNNVSNQEHIANQLRLGLGFSAIEGAIANVGLGHYNQISSGTGRWRVISMAAEVLSNTQDTPGGRLMWVADHQGAEPAPYTFTANTSGGSNWNSCFGFWAVDTLDRTCKIGTVDLPTDDTVDWVGPSLGFKPGFVAMLVTAVDSTSLGHSGTSPDREAHGFFATDFDASHSVSWASRSGGPSKVRSLASDDCRLFASGGDLMICHFRNMQAEADNWRVDAADVLAKYSPARKALYIAIEGVDDEGSISGDVSAQPATTSGPIEVLALADGDVSSQEATSDGELDSLTNISGDVVSEKAAVGGELQARIFLTGAVASELASTSGDLTSGLLVEGGVSSEGAAVDGDLLAIAELAGDVVSQVAATSGSLDVEAVIAGAVASQKAATSGLVTTSDARSVFGAVASEPASTSGDLNTVATIQGDVSSEKAITSGEIDLLVEIEGAVAAAFATTQGTIGQGVTISGDVAAEKATVGGSLTTPIRITGAVASQGVSTVGDIIAPIKVQGDVSSESSTVGGTLTITVTVEGFVVSALAEASGFIFMGTLEGRNYIEANALVDFHITQDVLTDWSVKQPT